MHYIRASVVNELIVSAIRGVAACVRMDEAAFVERVIIHEGDRSSGKRTQEVEIVFNFIGKFDAPFIPMPTPEIGETEILAQEELKRAKNREKLRRWRAKKKVEQASADLSETQTETA